MNYIYLDKYDLIIKDGDALFSSDGLTKVIEHDNDLYVNVGKKDFALMPLTEFIGTRPDDGEIRIFKLTHHNIYNNDIQHEKYLYRYQK